MALREIHISWGQGRASVLRNDTQQDIEVLDDVVFLPVPPGGNPIVDFRDESPFSAKHVEGTGPQTVRGDANQARSEAFRFDCQVEEAGTLHTGDGGEIPRPPRHA